MAESRTKNSKRNLVSGMIRQIVSLFFQFLIRTVILYVLGNEYLGLSSLFTSILQVLNLADLGFSSAVVYVLYKPIAEDDETAICAIIAYLKRVYKIVGCVILAIGLAILPFIPYLISGDYPSEINIYVLYVLYLLGSVVSYFFFAYKNALITAMQRNDIVTNVQTITIFVFNVIQVILLIFLKNFYLYVSVNVICNITNNIFVQILSKKYFPAITPKGKITAETKAVLTKQIKGIFINRIGDVARNSLDSIVLSSLLGLVVVAIYNNYFYIYNALYAITLIITHAVQASVGNSVVKESVEKNFNDYKKFTYIFAWITGWMTVCLVCLYQPFMLIWMNGDKSMLLSTPNMILFSIYFYAINMNSMRNMYVNAAGLYWELRLWYILEAIGNLVLNIVLGYFFGVTGVLLATIITIFLCNFVSRTNVLFKYYFKSSAWNIYKDHIIYFLVIVAVAVLTYFSCSLIPIAGILGLIIKAGICLLLPNVIFVLVSFKTKLFKETLSLTKRVISRKSKK